MDEWPELARPKSRLMIMAPEAQSARRRVFLVDDHPLVREWLATLIDQQPDLAVCGEAGNRARALQLLGTAEAEIVIVDISLEGGSGLELIKDIRVAHPKTIVIVLSMHDESLYAERALLAGARGYVMKREATRSVLQAIRSVLRGEVYLSGKFAAGVAQRFVQGGAHAVISPVEKLSDRELEVFQLLGRGYNTRQIAEELRVGFKTVQSFCARIKEKLNLSNATQLLREAVRWHEESNK